MRTWLKALGLALMAEAGLVCLLVVAMGRAVTPPVPPVSSQALTVRIFHPARMVRPNLDVNRASMAPASPLSRRETVAKKDNVPAAAESGPVAAIPAVPSAEPTQETAAGNGVDPGSPEPTAPAAQVVASAVGDVLAAYSAELFGRIAQKRSFPRIFRQRMTGVAEVELAIDRDGKLLSVELKKSAGYFQLDQQALQMVREAAPFLPLPSEYSDRLARFSLPISFSH